MAATPVRAGTTLVVTNDFPPRAGGIEAVVASMTAHLAQRGPVVVHTRSQDGDAAHDATLGHPVVRQRAGVLLPTRATAARVAATAREHGCDRVWFGAAAPLGLLAPALRRAGVERTVATTYGHEIWWAALPGTRAALRAVVDRNDVTTVVSAHAGAAIAAGLRPDQRERLVTLFPGVEPDVFAPSPALAAAALAVRERHGLVGRPVVLCLSRLVPRKGQDVLVAAWPAVAAAVPGAALVLAGSGPRAAALAAAVARAGLDAPRDAADPVSGGASVVMTGAVAPGELAAHHAAADVFAMPARSRFGGLEREGLGVCYLEAAAAGRPVVAGRSGGAPEAVLDGVSGRVVDGTDPSAVAAAVVALLRDPAGAAAMGERGRAWVGRGWTRAAAGERLRALLDGRDPDR